MNSYTNDIFSIANRKISRCLLKYKFPKCKTIQSARNFLLSLPPKFISQFYYANKVIWCRYQLANVVIDLRAVIGSPNYFLLECEIYVCICVRLLVSFILKLEMFSVVCVCCIMCFNMNTLKQIWMWMRIWMWL